MTDYCRDRSCALDEPLMATASHVRRWLLVEFAGPWPQRDWLRCVGPAEGALLRDFARRHGCRVVLVRRHLSEEATAGPRFFWADTEAGPDGTIRHVEGDAVSVLAIDAPEPGSWAEHHDPVWLVCVHSTHDLCCGIHGRALIREIGDDPRVWESSHIGGDRFAANVVELPTGVYYGRVTGEGWPEIPSAHRDDAVHLPLYRGRAVHDRIAQWADASARARFGLNRRDAVVLGVPEEAAGDGVFEVDVTVAGGEQPYRVRLEPVPTDPRLLTCKAVHEARPPAYRVVWPPGAP